MEGPVFAESQPAVESLGAALLNLRTLSGLSQRELAKRAGLTNSVISTIEQGKVSPSVCSLAKLLSGLGLSLAEFYALDNSGHKEAALAGAVCQRALSLPIGSLTQLMLSGSSGVSLACAKGDVIVRTLADSQRLRAGDSIVLPAHCAYVLENIGADDAALWSASISY